MSNIGSQVAGNKTAWRKRLEHELSYAGVAGYYLAEHNGVWALRSDNWPRESDIVLGKTVYDALYAITAINCKGGPRVPTK